MRVKGSHAESPQNFPPLCSENFGAGCREGRVRALDPRPPRAGLRASGSDEMPRRMASEPRFGIRLEGEEDERDVAEAREDLRADDRRG